MLAQLLRNAEAEANELPYARTVARAIGADHRVVDVVGDLPAQRGGVELAEVERRLTTLLEDWLRREEQELPLAIALRDLKPVHRAFTVRSAAGPQREIEVSAFPIVGNAGMRGAMAIFWDAGEET